MLELIAALLLIVVVIYIFEYATPKKTLKHTKTVIKGIYKLIQKIRGK